MRVRKVLFLIIFLFSSNSIIASEIDGIRIFQSAEGFLKIHNDKDRELEFNKNIRFYWNDSFNLSSSVHDNNDFKIPNPDYFFNEYLNKLALLGAILIILSGLISIPGQIRQINEK